MDFKGAWRPPLVRQIDDIDHIVRLHACNETFRIHKKKQLDLFIIKIGPADVEIWEVKHRPKLGRWGGYRVK